MSRSNLVQYFAGVLALADLAVLGAVMIGGNACRHGEGCLYYAALFFIAIAAAAVILIGSTGIWFYVRKRSGAGRFFLGSNLSLLVAALLMLGALAFEHAK